jgi:hypothetical protein
VRVNVNGELYDAFLIESTEVDDFGQPVDVGDELPEGFVAVQYIERPPNGVGTFDCILNTRLVPIDTLDFSDDLDVELEAIFSTEST